LAILTPGGHEAEIAGLNAFTSAVLSWLPPLIITVFNEQDMLRLGLLVVPVFWIIGATIISTINVEKATSDIASSLAVRQRYNDEEREGGLAVPPKGETL
jgi:hypothetical protein